MQVYTATWRGLTMEGREREATCNSLTPPALRAWQQTFLELYCSRNGGSCQNTKFSKCWVPNMARTKYKCQEYYGNRECVTPILWGQYTAGKRYVRSRSRLVVNIICTTVEPWFADFLKCRLCVILDTSIRSRTIIDHITIWPPEFWTPQWSRKRTTLLCV